MSVAEVGRSRYSRKGILSYEKRKAWPLRLEGHNAEGKLLKTCSFKDNGTSTVPNTEMHIMSLSRDVRLDIKPPYVAYVLES
jgi:hypothetical protein